METLALVVLILVLLIFFYGVIAIHDIPYEIAKKRNHPHSDSIHVAGWVSLFTLHVIWPFLWIWATLYQKDEGWGVETGSDNSEIEELQNQLEDIRGEIAALTERLGSSGQGGQQ